MRIYNGNYEYYLEKSGREHRAAWLSEGNNQENQILNLLQ
jgi:hypothetical protein